MLFIIFYYFFIFTLFKQAATVSKSLLENPVKRSKQIVRLLKKPNLKNTIVVGSMICFVDSISISRELANKLQISDKDLFWKLVSPHSVSFERK